jgi:hypothetical protein
MAVANGRSDDSAAFSQLISAAEAISADSIHSSPMTGLADHSNVGRGASDAAIAVGGPAHEVLHPSSRGEQTNGGSIAVVSLLFMLVSCELFFEWHPFSLVYPSVASVIMGLISPAYGS